MNSGVNEIPMLTSMSLQVQPAARRKGSDLHFLWVSNHTPFLVDFGGGQRSSLIYRTLRTMGTVDVLLICGPPPEGRTVEEIHGRPDGWMELVDPLKRGELAPWRWVRAGAPVLVDKVAYNFGRRKVDYQPDPRASGVFDRLLRNRQYDLVIGRHLKYTAKAGALRYGPTIIDVDDNELELYRTIIDDPCTSTLRRLVLRRRVRSLGKIVPKLLERTSRIWVSKEEDRSIPGCERATVLPNIPYAMSWPNPPSPLPPNYASETILFVGMLSYIYNFQGIDTFLADAWPQIRRAKPNARLRLVGSRVNPGDRNRWAAIPGVEVAGFVEDLQDAYRDCAFVVVPLWSGAGTNIKVSEALMYGRTCVVSKTAHRGYSGTLPHNRCLLVGKDTEEMATYCITLLNDPERRASLAEAGARSILNSLSFQQFQRTVVETIESAVCTNLHLQPQV